MKNTLLTLMIALLSLPECHARLGENAAALEKRFGPPVKEIKQKGAEIVQNQYINKDLLILVTLYKNISMVEHYMKLKSVPVGNEEAVLLPIPTELAAAILQAAAEGSQWSEIEETNYTRRLARNDKKALAVIVKEKGAIKEVRISSVDFAEALAGRTSSGQSK